MKRGPLARPFIAAAAIMLILAAASAAPAVRSMNYTIAQLKVPTSATFFVSPYVLVPVEKFSNVTYVGAGYNSTLIVTPTEATLLRPGNVTEFRVNPRLGSWVFGGVGTGGVALYSSLRHAFYVFSFNGTLEAVVPANISYSPVMISTYYSYGGYYVMVESQVGNNTVMNVYGSTGLVSNTTAPEEVILDPSSEIELTPKGIVLLQYNINVSASPIMSTASVNGPAVAFVSVTGNLYIYNFSSGEEYVMIGAQRLETSKVVPLTEGEVLIYNRTELSAYVVNYTSIVDGEFPVRIRASAPSARILVNGTQVGVGSATVYDTLGVINVTAECPGYYPASQVVVPQAPMVVTLSLRPIMTNVTFRVVSPIPVSYFVLYVNGSPVRLAPGSTLSLQAVVPYQLVVNTFMPYNVCEPIYMTVSLPESPYTLNLTCTLVEPVLLLYTSVEANVTVRSSLGVVYRGELSPGQDLYLPVSPGSYEVVSTAPGRQRSNLTLALSSPAVYSYNVTPPSIPSAGTLEVVANVSDASVYVEYPNGTVIAVGVDGRVAVQLSPGQYIVVARAPGYANVTRSVSVSPGAHVSLTLGLAPLEAPHRRSSGASPVIYAAAGVTAAAAALGAYYYMSTRRARRVPQSV